nr:hypothetical protein [Marinobacter sp.]
MGQQHCCVDHNVMVFSAPVLRECVVVKCFRPPSFSFPVGLFCHIWWQSAIVERLDQFKREVAEKGPAECPDVAGEMNRRFSTLCANHFLPEFCEIALDLIGFQTSLGLDWTNVVLKTHHAAHWFS